MHSTTALRERFTDGGLATASGPKIIQLAFERLDRDLAAALDAIARRDVPVAHDQLVHAQDIVHELLLMLDVDAWEHAPTLAAIYRYVLDLLTRANVHKDAVPAGEARALLAELGSAFRGAAAQPLLPAEPVAAGASRAFSARA